MVDRFLPVMWPATQGEEGEVGSLAVQTRASDGTNLFFRAITGGDLTSLVESRETRCRVVDRRDLKDGGDSLSHFWESLSSCSRDSPNKVSPESIMYSFVPARGGPNCLTGKERNETRSPYIFICRTHRTSSVVFSYSDEGRTKRPFFFSFLLRI